MIIHFICPLLYSLLLGGTWSLLFKKKFSSSLAPAFMSHIIIVLLSGMICQSITYGVFGGIAIAVVIDIVLLIRSRHIIGKSTLTKCFGKIWDNGFFIFFIFYIFCFLINFKKLFLSWDEFMNWGVFLKETLRLDRLFATSPLTIAHRDYVPAITLFETIWCYISGRFTEANAYRAIQILMFSLLLPMFERFGDDSIAEGVKDGRSIKRIKGRLFSLCPVIVVLLVPLLFDPRNGFQFYHSICCDLILGLLFYWCLFECFREYDNYIYQFFTTTIGMTVFAFTKMTAIALFPLIIGFLILKFFALKKYSHIKIYSLGIVLMMVIPIGLWFCFNKYVKFYVGQSSDLQCYDVTMFPIMKEVYAGGMQSYNVINFSSIKDIFFASESKTIPYLLELRRNYINAIIHTDILLHGSYIVALIILIIAFLVLARYAKESLMKRKILMTGLWTLISGVYYALLMYFLYATTFSESSAVSLASYARYMNSFIIAVLLLLIAVFYESKLWKNHQKALNVGLAAILLLLLLFHIDVFDQVLPGSITFDEETNREYLSYAYNISNLTPEDAKIFIIRRADNMEFIWHERYYCNPRTIDGGSVGPASYDSDIWSIDLSTEEFIDTLSKYDYVYFCGFDSAFFDKYSGCFDDPAKVVSGKLYEISTDNSRISLRDMN